MTRKVSLRGRAVIATSIEQSKDSYSVGSSDKDLPVDDQGRDELVAVAEVVAATCRLVAVVEFIQICGVVGVEHGGRGIFYGPHNAVGGSVGTDCGGSAGILKCVRAMELHDRLSILVRMAPERMRPCGLDRTENRFRAV